MMESVIDSVIDKFNMDMVAQGNFVTPAPPSPTLSPTLNPTPRRRPRSRKSMQRSRLLPIPTPAGIALTQESPAPVVRKFRRTQPTTTTSTTSTITATEPPSTPTSPPTPPPPIAKQTSATELLPAPPSKIPRLRRPPTAVAIPMPADALSQELPAPVRKFKFCRTRPTTTTSTTSTTTATEPSSTSASPPPPPPLTPLIAEPTRTSKVEDLRDLAKNDPQRVYLVTYSKADYKQFPTRKSFAMKVVAAFGAHNVDYFGCAKEHHMQTGGQHYHMSLRLASSCRWLTAKNKLASDNGIVVNFKESPDGGMYKRVFSYIQKEDEDIYLGGVSLPHPDLSSLTNVVAERANDVYRENRAKASAAKEASASKEPPQKKKKEKARKIDRLDVAMYIRKKDITDELQLFAAAEERNDAGERDLAKFLMHLGTKGRQEVIRDAWKLQGARQQITLRDKSRVDIMTETAADIQNCICGGMWLQLAVDLCSKNGLEPDNVSQVLYRSLTGGRKKHRNVLITGPSNCGKTFLLEPLRTVFVHTFHTPASSVFGWLGVENAQVIYLNDFRWHNPVTQKAGIVTWDAFLRLLEGAQCDLPAPMNHCSDHIRLTPKHDMPILCTSDDVIRFYVRDLNEPQTPKHVKENRMMSERWINPVLELHHVFDEQDKVLCEPCGYCFCKFVLSMY